MDSSLLTKGKDQGYLLSDEIIAAFPNAEEQLDSLEEFYSAIVAEGIDRHPGIRVDLLQVAIGCKDQSAVGVILALPVI